VSAHPSPAVAAASAAPLWFEQERPHDGYPAEWWFFHGGFSAPGGSHHHEFMVIVFRMAASREGEPVDDGYVLMLSLLDVAAGKNYVLSQVDDAILRGTIKRVEVLDKTEVDREVARVLIKELERHGPPRPIRLGAGSAQVLVDPLRISWGDFAMRQGGEGFDVAFTIPDHGGRISLSLRPEYPRLVWDCEERNQVLRADMFFASYPRMTLSGSIDGAPVTGTAWFDHQWCEASWFVPEDPQGLVQGWDWLGFNLDDGMDIIVSNMKNIRADTVLSSNVLVRTAGGEVTEYTGAKVTPLRLWESPLTHVKYPVECRVTVPALDLDVVFQPLLDDQEVPFIGVTRSIWEGAGTVSGTMGDKEVHGRARGEFNGYGYIFDFQEYLQTLADRVDRWIEDFLPKKFGEAELERFVGKPHWRHEPEAYTTLLSTPVWDLILRRGKRWRPIFGILMLEALGVPSRDYEASFCLAELVHSGALIIDDIEDGSLLRRGEPCTHIKFGTDVAINAGNALYFLPSVELFHHRYLDDAQKLRIHEIMMQTDIKAHFGQTLDLYWSKRLTPENLAAWLEGPLEDKILQQYDFKTAAGAEGLAEVATVIARADEIVTKVCVDFARAFGVAYQIIDDVHNFSDSPQWTKTCGEDLAGGKPTYAIVRAIRRLEGADRDRLVAILCSPELRADPRVVREGIALVRQSGALEECRETARRMSDDENERFREVIPSCEAKIMLSLLCASMLDLAFET
jgi:geranylgeranyl pyrophosphate synthase/predicted secreted hydrolase